MNEMERLNEWLDSVDAPKVDTRGWAYTVIGRIDGLFDKEKQALKQRLIDAFHEHYARKMQVPMIYKEVIELIEKEFSDK